MYYLPDHIFGWAMAHLADPVELFVDMHFVLKSHITHSPVSGTGMVESFPVQVSGVINENISHSHHIRRSCLLANFITVLN